MNWVMKVSCLHAFHQSKLSSVPKQGFACGNGCKKKKNLLGV